MNPHDLSAVRDFFIEFDNVQLETWNLKPTSAGPADKLVAPDHAGTKAIYDALV